MTIPSGSNNPVEDSQLSLFSRINLLIRNPKDAFSLLSFQERRVTALVVFFSYFLIKFPIVLQRTFIDGKFNDLSISSALSYIVGGLIGGMLVTLLLFLLTAWVIHLILNKWKKADQCFEDAFTLLVLSLAPQLLLVFELPFLLIAYQELNTLFSVLILRLVVDLISLRVFYWGLRTIFNVTATKAIAVIALPAIILSILLIKLLFI
ncbi:MAG: hypothetical protein GQ532_10805 [Methylomarinum sp.]|nr:hypothetical protein [Methylomarinum sp.]